MRAHLARRSSELLKMANNFADGRCAQAPTQARIANTFADGRAVLNSPDLL
jgi:hypothetical protein